MDFKINKEECLICGLCVDIAKENFRCVDNQHAIEFYKTAKESEIQNCLEAMENCPTKAIIKI